MNSSVTYSGWAAKASANDEDSKPRNKRPGINGVEAGFLDVGTAAEGQSGRQTHYAGAADQASPKAAATPA